MYAKLKKEKRLSVDSIVTVKYNRISRYKAISLLWKEGVMEKREHQ